MNKNVQMLLFHPLHIPPMSCRHAAENHSGLDCVETRRETDPASRGLVFLWQLNEGARGAIDLLYAPIQRRQSFLRKVGTSSTNDIVVKFSLFEFRF